MTSGMESALLDELWRVYDRVNAERFGRRLVRPVLGLSARSSDLGRWSPLPRTLELSWTLLVERPWCEVVAVLEHEMAHQYVSEVLGVADETPHGPTFRRVCAERGIDAGVGEPVQPADAEEPRIVRRIRKLLALADSPEPAEARAAAARASALMLEHNIRRVEARATPRFVVRQAGPVAVRWAKHDSLLAGLLAQHFFVQVTFVPGFDVATGRRGKALELAGSAENVEIAAYVFDVVRRAGAEAWARHDGGARAADRHRFLEGFVLGYRDQLAGVVVEARERGLVWRGDPGLEAFVAARFPRGLRTRRAHVAHEGSHGAGREAGRRLVLRKPVTDRGDGVVGALPGPVRRG